MGIRFYCPNGHKLHVKQFLAGKRGVCPHCGVKLLIPQQSDPTLAKRSAKRADAAGNSPSPLEPPAATGAGSDLLGSATDTRQGERNDLSQPASSGHEMDDREKGSDQVDVATGKPGSRRKEAAESPPKAASGPFEPLSQPAGRPHLDPIAEAPQAVWYVRPPSGGQFGPATGDAIRQWLHEGRVTADSIVWREGWEQWQPASKVFPNLSGALQNAEGLPVVVAADTPSSQALQHRRKRDRRVTTLVVSLLAICCLLLFATLIYVIRYVG